MDTRIDVVSGVGVLDKSMAILAALESSSSSLAELVAATGFSRPTTYRLAAALEEHRLVQRDERGDYHLGARLGELATAVAADPLAEAAEPVLVRLRDASGESAQLFRRQGAGRVCVAVADRAYGLRDSIPVGAVLTMTAGSAAQVLLAWAGEDVFYPGVRKAAFTAAQLAAVRRRGWAQSVAEREAGVASVSAPVRGQTGAVIAALSISGPIERLTKQPGRKFGALVIAAAAELSGAGTAF